MNDSSMDSPHGPAEIEVRPQEQLLIEALDDFSPGRVLCTSQGLAQLAAAAARRFSSATVYCHYLDLYPAQQARRYADNALANLTIGCSSDFPPQTVNLAALPFSQRGEAELTRELLQERIGVWNPAGFSWPAPTTRTTAGCTRKCERCLPR